MAASGEVLPTANSDEPRSTRDRISRLRGAAGLTQSDLARLSGIARAYVGLIESGARVEIGVSKLVRLAFVLGASLDYVVLGHGKQPTPRQVRAAVERARREPTAVADAVAQALGGPDAAAPGSPSPPRPRARAKPLRRRSSPPPTNEARA